MGLGSGEIGVNGSVMDQLGNDSGRGAVLGPFKAQSFGVGPAILEIRGSSPRMTSRRVR